MKRQTKILALLVAVAVVSFSSVVWAAETVSLSGTFTPTGTLSITCNNTAPAFGTIGLGASAKVANINVSNNGNVSCSVTSAAVETNSSSWTISAGNYSVTGPNLFSVAINNRSGDWLDASSTATISANLTAYQGKFFDLTVFVSNTTSVASALQTIYFNMTAAALS